jgi:hypothetical protein
VFDFPAFSREMPEFFYPQAGKIRHLPLFVSEPESSTTGTRSVDFG